MKLDLKSLIIGTTVGVLLTSSFSIADLGQSHVKVENAYTSPSIVVMNNQEIPLEHPLLEVIHKDSDEAMLYMPMEDVLDHLYVQSNWDKDNNAVHLSSAMPMPKINTHLIDLSSGKDLDTQVIELMKNTGNWAYVEPYLQQLSDESLAKIIEIYNSKHPNTKEHKHVNDFINDIEESIKVNLHFSADVKDANHVGDQWNYYIECNGITYYPQNQNAEIELKESDLVLNLVVYEYDKGQSDYGSKKITIPYDLLNKRDTLKFTYDLSVVENGGRYAGNAASVEYTVSIIPRY